jgi:hypothetical protein
MRVSNTKIRKWAKDLGFDPNAYSLSKLREYLESEVADLILDGWEDARELDKDLLIWIIYNSITTEDELREEFGITSTDFPALPTKSGGGGDGPSPSVYHRNLYSRKLRIFKR